MAPPEPCLAIAGPTASGKTAIALALAGRVRERLGLAVEIISVDSALVYRGMDIGTAKPDARERTIAPHHLIDILDPAQSYSAAAFAADARRLVDDIRARGAIPLLVGGTMLYFRALMQGLHDMPASSAAVRAEIDAQAAAQGWPALHAELARVDPQTAARLSPMDSQRIQRALEVWRVSGRPMSHFHAAPTPASDHGVPVTLFSLEPQNRAWLHARIAQRFDAMLQQGFVDEVRTLRQRQDLHANLPSMRCVGYRQAWDMLDALQTQGVCGDAVPQEALDVLRERATAATRQLAKRQLTWLRSMARREVLPCDQAGIGAVAVQRLLARLHDTNSKSA